METKPLDPADSLRIIESSIKEAKAEQTGAAFYYKVWGSILFAYFLAGYLIMTNPAIKASPVADFTWILFPLGGILSFLRKSGEKEKTVPHFERVYLFSFAGFAIAYGTVFLASLFLQMNLALLLFPLLLGITVFITGGITRHTPSLAGGLLSVACAVTGIFSTTETQYLLAAMAAVLSCAIPGFLMRNKNV